MNSFIVARIELDGRHISGLGHQLRDAYTAATLSAAGVPTALYAGKREGTIAELARQLARSRSAAVLMPVDPTTIDAARRIGAEVHRIRPALSVLFQWEASHAPPVEADERLVVARSAAELLAAVAPATAMPTHDASPYRDGPLAPADLPRLGMLLDQAPAAFARELDWLTTVTEPLAGPVPLEAGGAGAARVADALRQIAALTITHGFSLRLHAGDWAAESAKLLLPARIEHIVVTGGAAAVTADTAGLGIRVEEREEDDRLAVRYARNGLMVEHTGLYFDANPAAGTYHLSLPATMPAVDRRAAYEWAGRDMAIRSAAVLIGPDALLEQLDDHIGPASAETGGWPRHIYALAQDGADPRTSRLMIDGAPLPAATIRYRPLAELGDSPTEPGALTFVTIRDAADVAILEKELSDFHATGRLRLPHPRLSVCYENSCRWLGFGACKVSLLRRLAVEADGSVTACHDSGQVGTVGEPIDKMLRTTRQRFQFMEVTRGCATCVVRDQCSHCCHLPALWEGRYCEIRRNYPQISLFFELQAFVQLVAGRLTGSDDYVDLLVTGEGLGGAVSAQAGEARTGNRPLLIEVGGQHLAWWRGTRRLVRLSRPLAVIATAWWNGSGDVDIADDLVRSFAVDLPTARASLEQGMDKLREGGVIHA